MKTTYLLSISLAALIGATLPGAKTGASSGPKNAAFARSVPIAWLSVSEAASKLDKEKKPVLIDLYTTWCGWCKQMDKKTYSNKSVASYLNDKFYTVKFDAESRSPITWEGKTYNYNPQYRVNEFALYLAHGQLEFPTTIIIVPGEAPQAIPGYLEPRDIEPLVKYFGEGDYRTRGFDDYHRHFRPSW